MSWRGQVNGGGTLCRGQINENVMEGTVSHYNACATLFAR